MQHFDHETAVIAAKSAPPVTVVGLSLGGVSLQDWVFILTCVYLVFQIGFLLWDRVFRKRAHHDSKH